VYADDDGEPGDLIAEYRYDALNRRIAKIVPNGENWDRTDYYYAGARVVEERFASAQANKDTPASSAKFQYVWDIRYVHAAVLRDEDTDSDGDCTDEGSERLYYTQDANFNVTSLVETDGDVIERYVYDPYGKRTIYDGSWSEISWEDSKKNEILFTGHRLNPESGLYYGGWRYYHPTLGRWISWDLTRYADGMNLYEYVQGRPLVRADRLGLKSDVPWHEDTSRLPGYDKLTPKEQRSQKPNCTKARQCYAECVEFFIYCLSCKTVRYEDKDAGIDETGFSACYECLKTCLLSCYHQGIQRNPCCLSGCKESERPGTPRRQPVTEKPSVAQEIGEEMAEAAGELAIDAAEEMVGKFGQELGKATGSGTGVICPPGATEAAGAAEVVAEATKTLGPYILAPPTERVKMAGDEKYFCLPQNVFTYTTMHQLQGSLDRVPGDLRSNKRKEDWRGPR